MDQCIIPKENNVYTIKRGLRRLFKINVCLLTDCIYGFSNHGLSYESANYCLCHVASDWML